MRKHVLLPLIFVGLALILSSCATTGASGSRGSGNKLTAEEIAEVSANTAYEVVEIARRQWLRQRALRTGSNQAMGSQEGAVVYLDGVRIGDVSELRRIRATVVAEMEYLSPSDATNRFGTNHDQGAILVTTR